MATTSVEVVSPARVLYTGEAEMVVCRTDGGEIAFLANHIPYLGALDPCVTRLIAEDGSETRIAVSGGFVEVRDNRVIVLADRAELGSDVDVEAARAEVREAQGRLSGASGDDVAVAELDVRRAEVRLEAAGANAD
ncbi:MAG TPA: ATP synthase F1 subunit epsilon [Acidimicrobiales bacterium]|nr:ATP synthase F1 subunit epsilon [Acidimicrobiales bacterium]